MVITYNGMLATELGEVRWQRGQLDALPVRIAVPALLPADLAEFRGEHAIVRNDHFYPLSRG